MTLESSLPGPERPSDPRDELVQALLGLRWALPRTDADARVALEQLSAVTERLAQLAAASAGDAESPWEGQVQTLLAQAGFALDWWRPVLDDIDLDWTLNHQAHLAADLARIASAGARILDRYAPAVPHPHESEGPFTLPPTGNRVLAAFGSVPATAIIDPLANSGRHRRPAYDFDAPTGHSAHPPARPASRHHPVAPRRTPAPAEPQPPASPTGLPPAVGQAPGHQQLLYPQIVEFNPVPAPTAPAPIYPNPDAEVVANLLAPPPPIPVQQPVEDLLESPLLPAPSRPRAPAQAPPSAFTPPIIWGGSPDAVFDDEDDDPIVRSDRHLLRSGGMVVQAFGILGVVGALCWWAIASLHPGAAPPSHPVAGTAATHAPAQGAPARSGASLSGTKTTPPPAKAATSAPAVPPSSAAPPVAPPAAGAATVTALQVSLLGGSVAQQQVAMVLSVNASGTGQFTVTVDYYGMRNGAKIDERAASWTLSGKTSYQIGATIPTNAYCGTVFTLTARGGDATSTQTTSPC